MTGTYECVDLGMMPADRRAALLDSIHRTVLVPAFPPSEMTPLAVLHERWAGTPPRLAVRAAIDSAGRPIACAVAEWFPGSRTLLLAYLAVIAERRGEGIGTDLVTGAVLGWGVAYRPALMVAEVEDPRVHPPMPGQDPSARLRLYARLGARLLDLHYVQPEITPGAGRVRDLLLLVEPDRSAAVTTDRDGVPRIPATLVRDFLVEYYLDSEGASANDAEFDAMVGGLAGLTIMPLSTVPPW